MKLGLFDSPEKVPFNKIPYDVVDCDEHKKLNLMAACKCITLLKNADNILPLDISKINTIGVVGPNADNRRALVGNYEGTASQYITVLDGIHEYAQGKARVVSSVGCDLFRDRTSGLARCNDRLAEAKAVAAMSDVVIACFGLDSGLEGEEGEAESSEETESVEETEEGDVRFSSEDTSVEGSSDSGSGSTDEDLGEEDAGDGSTDEESGADEGTEETGTDESAEETSN